MKKEFFTSMLLTLTVVLSASAFAADKKEHSKEKEITKVADTIKHNSKSSLVKVSTNKIELKSSAKSDKKKMKKDSEMKKMDHKDSKAKTKIK